MNSIDQKIKKARARLLLDYPFYGALAIRLDMVPAVNAGKHQIDTAATDGKAIYYNELYIDSLTHNELIFLLAHEIGHVLFKHHTRRAGREPKTWNQAGDHAINLILSKEKIGTVIQGALVDKRFQNMATEQIFKILQDQGGQGKKNQKDSNTIDDPCGGVIDRPKDQEPAELESDLKESIQNAMQHAARAGKEPGQAIQSIVKNLIAPKANWRELLKNWISSQDQTDFSFVRPSNRSNNGYIMPGLYSESIGKIVIAIDTSGSVLSYQGAVDSFQVEINSLRRSFQTDIELLYFHKDIYKIDNFQKYQDIKINITETGGTRIKPVFDHVKSNGQISGLIVFTDMEIFDFPKNDPRYPLLWLQYGNIGYSTNTGTTIKINNN